MISTILNHKTIRKYKPDPIDDKILNEILKAGTRASNTGNMQVYSIIVTKNQEIKNKLWEQHFKQEMVRQAPVVLTFCADFNRFNKWCNLNNANPRYDNFLSFYTATVDAVIVAQNVAIAAEAHNLGICYLGTTNYTVDKISEILNLPEGVVPVTTLVLGYPDENPPLTGRLPERAVIHIETYNDFTDTEIAEIYSELENSDFAKQLIKENSTENFSQIFTQKRYTEANNIHFSKNLLNFIEKQKFMNNK